MIRALAFACCFTATCAVACADDDGPMLTGRSVASASCDRVAPVCGVMGKDRLVPYASECDARADGAARVTFGGCFDQD